MDDENKTRKLIVGVIVVVLCLALSLTALFAIRKKNVPKKESPTETTTRDQSSDQSPENQSASQIPANNGSSSVPSKNQDDQAAGTSPEQSSSATSSQSSSALKNSSQSAKSVSKTPVAGPELPQPQMDDVY